MPFIDVLARQLHDLTPQIHTRTFWGERMLVGIVDLDANAVLPEHSHPHEQITYIVRGAMDFDLGGEKRSVHQGDLILIPGGMPHSAVVGSEPTQAVDVFCPPREDMKY